MNGKSTATDVMSTTNQQQDSATISAAGEYDNEASTGITSDVRDEIDNDKEKNNNNYDDDNEFENEDDVSSANSEDTLEPDCDKANSLSFYQICHRMETLWKRRTIRNKHKHKKISDFEKKKYILPVQLLKSMQSESVFPLLRLLVPDIDNSRATTMKEKMIAQAYCDAEGYTKGTSNYEMLYNFTDPQKVPPQAAGDLSLVVQHVLNRRIPQTPSKVTVGQMNIFLNDLANLRQQRQASHSHEWRQGNSKKKQKEKVSSLRQQWLRKVMNKGLSPLEHKWLVRILLKKMEFGLGWRAILNWYNPYAMELWNAHNSLKNLCDKLADPLYTKHRKEAEEIQEAMRQDMASRWQPQSQPAVLGNTISPMLSNRVSFANCMTQIQFNHKEFLKQSSGSSTSTAPLSLRYPTIAAEIKLDGERMIIHMTKEGIVTMHTRNGKWYSQLYSPALGPPLRMALSKYKVDVILDGEVTSWDNFRQENIPFGSNRTVANFRRSYLHRHGLLDKRDENLHNSNSTATTSSMMIMKAADEYRYVKKKPSPGSEDDLAGKECWLQFVAFDILYLGGPDAERVLSDCGISNTNDYNVNNSPSHYDGSIIHLTGFQRKHILYQLIEEQPNEVEICKSVIIRSNGKCVSGTKYFSTSNPLMECGYAARHLDSTEIMLDNKSTLIPKLAKLQELDHQRRFGNSNTDISRLRSQAVDEFYKTVVEKHRMEGLVLKDLAAPYIFGGDSRRRKYWHKFKPDYEKNAVDIDVVILGAYFATGLRNSGKLSHFLCGCADSENRSLFMTLCNVNGGSVTYEKLDAILDKTGFKRATEDDDMQLGKWFQCDDGSLPDFISPRSLQRGGTEDFNGWEYNKNKNYPDLWIHPEDSVVLTIFGQELVISEEYSAGTSLRFARIFKVRLEAVDGDEKPPSEVDSDQDLWHIYLENVKQRQESTMSVTSSSFSPSQQANRVRSGSIIASTCRFLTPEEYGRKSSKRKRKAVPSPSTKVPKIDKLESAALNGLTFIILEGSYSLDRQSLDAEEAKQQGWFDAGAAVRKKEDVMEFVLKHGGTINVSVDSGKDNVFIVGGRKTDARVVQIMKGINYARSLTIQEKPTTKKAIRLGNMAKNVGILKWRYVFSTVHRWLSEQSMTTKKCREGTESEKEEDYSCDTICIKTSCPEMLQPRKHDYLVRSTIHLDNDDNSVFSLDASSKLVTLIDLRRGLEDISRKDVGPTAHQQSQIRRPWQYVGMYDMPEEDRWVLSCQYQSLWPCHLNGASLGVGHEANPAVLYPDFFRSGYGLLDEQDAVTEALSGIQSERWKTIVECGTLQSCLPLAGAMGAIVTPHLHAGVTHVLCDLEGETSEIVIDNFEDTNVNLEIFQDLQRGKELLRRLVQVSSTCHGRPFEVLLVSPVWLRSRWAADPTAA